jgi:hypothetical protein
MLAAIDIKNTFNTLRWNKILQESEARRINNYDTFQKLFILNVNNYFFYLMLEDKKIVIHNEGGSIKRGVNVGDPQGSNLGLHLWSIVYDGLLRVLWVIKNLNATALAER